MVPDLSDCLPVVVHVLEDGNQLELHVDRRLQPHDRRRELLTDTPRERPVTQCENQSRNSVITAERHLKILLSINKHFLSEKRRQLKRLAVKVSTVDLKGFAKFPEKFLIKCH